MRWLSRVLASVGSVVVTRGTSAVTVTVWLTSPGERTGSICTVLPVSSTTTCSHAFRPVASQWILYLPICTGGIAK